MTEDQVNTFLKLQPNLAILHAELGLLSKKSPNDSINKFKLKFINALLSQANDILGVDYKPFDDFLLFSEAEIPSNSDVVFIIAPYLRSLEKLRCDNIQDEGMFPHHWFWVINGQMNREYQTDKPTIK